MPYKEGKKGRAAVRFTPSDGKQLRRTKLFDKKREAEAWERETANALELADPQKRKDMNMAGRALASGEWAEMYLDYGKSRWVEKTFDEKRRTFRRLFRDSIRPELLVAEISPTVALEHLSNLKQRKTGNAANKDRKNLVAAWHWGIKYHNMKRVNPFQLVDKFPEERHPRYVPPIVDFKAVVDLADEYERFVLLTTFFTAGRKSEIFRIKWDEVDFDRKTVGLWTRKRNGGDWEYDLIPMADSLRFEFAKRKLKAGKAEHVFDQTHKMVKDTHNRWLGRLCKKADVKRFGFHSVRHLAGSIGIQAGASILDIQQLLRHVSKRTTERYIHRLTQNNRAVDALNKSMQTPANGQSPWDKVEGEG
ncbi:tyrosine-type recombinase/integrase [Salidesulfovibrio brasiliensis]|uniref:tyrosine-type recombinase/integrase n=1 Tax=Salidesulfovibrio brasiliensis TaxID=221711 RepID=UPI0006D250F0|nr:site-specific integrase [Salidesulfovibrio brasiliensis]